VIGTSANAPRLNTVFGCASTAATPTATRTGIDRIRPIASSLAIPTSAHRAASPGGTMASPNAFGHSTPKLNRPHGNAVNPMLTTPATAIAAGRAPKS
jgi:hypothetical protein